MSGGLTPRDCREAIADLAQILPEAFRSHVRERIRWPDLKTSADDRGRNRWDPVFTGGCIVDFLVTDPAALPPSTTKDVDTVIEIHSYGEMEQVEEALRVSGFSRIISEEIPKETWFWHGLRVDILPHQDPLSKTPFNPWFEEILKTAMRVEVLPGRHAWIATAPAFLASKCVAFRDRGWKDLLASKDLEDILAVIDGPPELGEEIFSSSLDVRNYLRTQFVAMLEDDGMLDAFSALVPDEGRAGVVVQRMRRIVMG